MCPSLLIFFAVKEEASGLVVPPTARARVRVLITGMGRENASEGIQAALRSGKPGLILTCGFAGGLRPDLRTGAVVFSADEDTGLAPVLLQLGAVPARFHCADRIACTETEKRSLRAGTGADAVEMESEIIRQIGREHGIPSATVRVILDTSAENLPLDFNHLLSKRFAIQYRKLAWTLLKSPHRIPALIRFRKQTQQAAYRLGTLLSGLLENLSRPAL